MKHHVLIAAPGRDVEAVLAAEALRKAAREAGLDVEVQLALDDAAPLAHPSARVVPVDAVLADPAAVLANLAAAPAADATPTRIVAITSCPTGIAHTFMAAEGLQQGAAELGHAIRIETQGSVGAGTPLTAQEIAEADVVIIAADREVDRARFAGKRVFASNTKPAITGGAALITRALAEASVQAGGEETTAPAKAERTGPYKHLMTGVSFMLPFVVAGGLLIALAFALGGIHANDDAAAGTLAHTLFEIGAKGGFALIVPALAGYIAYSIADRPGIAPGMIGGMIAASQGAGFLGGIVAGFIAGYGVDALNRAIRLPRNLAGLKPMLILPLLGTLLTGLLMVYAVGTPVAAVLSFLTEWLRGMQGSSAIALGLILGAMMAFDMGGPVNKASYAFSVGLIASQVYTPMAATMAAGMTPPLGIALATVLFRNRFSAEERDGAGATAVLGLAFITEGAIPFAARDPLRMIPAFVAGSALAGAISMAMGVELRVPHGGVFVLPIPGAVTHLAAYAVAIAAGTLTTALLAGLLRRPLAANPAQDPATLPATA
ncbi:PTS system fructose-specific IIC component [Novosphingobium sp. 1529]|uniref:PTS fructose transporter subunit IIC n=1 Tax=Novosphingobium sp. 1529 TaxID=3156424 RepID=UPI00339577B3